MDDLKNEKVINFIRLYLYLAIFYFPFHMAVLAFEENGFSLYYIFFGIGMISAFTILINLKVVAGLIESKKSSY